MKPTTLLNLRRWHHYIGVFLAPSILFFAVSGFVQVVGWQDQRNPPPPGWVSWMAGVHKHQEAPRPRVPTSPRPAAASVPRGGGDHDHDARILVPLKIFALLTALGLLLSTLIGVAVALGTRTMRRKSLAMLAAGIAVPIVLMLA